MRTVVTLDTLDPDTSTVVAHTSTTLNEPDLLFDPSVIELIPELKTRLEMPPRSDYRVYYQHSHIRDLSSLFGPLGLRLIPQTVLHPKFDRVKSILQTEPPHDSNTTLSIIGDPRMFPFDRYLILYEVDGGAFLEYGKKITRIDSSFEVLPRFPGLVVRELSRQELENWDGFRGREFDKSLAANKQNNSNLKQYKSEFWMGPGVALSVERSLYLRVLTIALGIAAVVSMCFVFLLSEPSSYFLNSLGTFAALWGVRSILTVSAPKSPNVIDFVVLVLFIVQIVLVAVRFLLKRQQVSKATDPALRH